MAGQWKMNVGGRVYGPFSTERMHAFVAEGRLAAASMVADGNSFDWQEAGFVPEFAVLFEPRPEVEPVAASVPAPASEQPTPPPEQACAPESNRAHFAIVVDVKSPRGGDLEQAIVSFGPAYRLLPNIWILSTEQTVNAVRNRLIQELGKADSLFVVDASRGKASWFNFGPEADVRIRNVWQKAS